MFDLKWQDSYLIGDALIDSEHKKLFEIARKAKEVVEPSMRKQKIKDGIRNIYEYSKTHFKHEEEYMSFIKFPAIEEHKKAHLKIIEAMNNFIKKSSSMSAIEFEKQLSYFIETLMLSHILINDKKTIIWKKQNENIKYKVEFKKEYLSGNEEIDQGHKKLFEIASNFFREYEDKTIKMNNIKTSLKELSKYIKLHFEHEEEFLSSLSEHDPIQRHKKLHQNIISDFNNLITKIPKLKMHEIELELTHFIEISLIHHIVAEDEKILNYHESMLGYHEKMYVLADT